MSDDRRSVLKGLSTTDTDDVTQKVKDLVRSWNDRQLSPDLIHTVQRNTKNSDEKSSSKCNLFVIAVNADASKRLVKGAKRHLSVNSGLKWKRYEHKFQSAVNRKSVIKGLDTRGIDNVTEHVRHMVSQWRDRKVNAGMIRSVERNRRSLSSADDKCNLFVTASDAKVIIRVTIVT